MKFISTFLWFILLEFLCGMIWLGYFVEDSYAQGEVESIVRQMRDQGLDDALIRERLGSMGLGSTTLALQDSLGIRAIDLDSLLIENTRIQNLMLRFRQQERKKRGLPSEIEILPDTLGKRILKPFGYDLFNNYVPSTFQPISFGAAGPDYIFGPGDEIELTMWGDTDYYQKLQVDREGNIFINKVGKISISGLSLSKLRTSLPQRLQRYYSGISLDGEGGTTFVDVSLGRIRPVQVWVTGAKTSSLYTLNALASPLHALFLAGGPAEGGSLRHVLVKHDDKTTDEVDLYQFLLFGDRKKSIRLRDNDMVVIPPLKKQVALSGEIRVPAYFEVLPNEALEQLLEMGGGFTAAANQHQIQIWRYNRPDVQASGIHDRQVSTVDFLSEKGKKFELADGDSIHVYPLRKTIENIVEVTGAIKWQGQYEWQKGLTLSELIKQAGGVLPEAFTRKIEIVRIGKDSTRQMVNVNLEEILEASKTADFLLFPLDRITVYSKWVLSQRDSVTIFGAVKKPGRYQYYENMTVENLIMKAGGFIESSLKTKAEISRIILRNEVSNQISEKIVVEIDSLLAQNKFADSYLKKSDIVFVREDPDWQVQEKIFLTGEVRFPGVYALEKRGERVSAVIKKAGGFTEMAYPEGVRFIRQKNNIGRVAVNLKRAMENPNGIEDVELINGDSLWVSDRQLTVKVEGEVGLPASVQYKEGADYKYYIEGAGGFTERSDKKNVKIILANGQITRPRRFGRNVAIMPGSVIIIPRKPIEPPTNWTQFVANTTQIISSLVTTVFIINQVTK